MMSPNMTYLLQVNNLTRDLYHGVHLVMLHEVGQGLELLASSNVEFAIL